MFYVSGVAEELINNFLRPKSSETSDIDNNNEARQPAYNESLVDRLISVISQSVKCGEFQEFRLSFARFFSFEV